MNIPLKNKKTIAFGVQPWVLETVVFFAVLWQESFRLSSRTSQKPLPVSAEMQHYYYYNFGDFLNGYVIAYLFDGIFNILFLKNKDAIPVLAIKVTKRRSSCASVLFSTVIVIIFELTPSISTTSDLMDVPAGLTGAFLYLIIRGIALSYTH